MESFVTQKFQHVCKFEMHMYLRFHLFNLKFRYMAANRHTHTSCNVVTLVWGSLRLAPIITIVQSYTGKYHEFVAGCIVTSAQHKQQCQQQQTSDIFFGIAWYYGDNDSIIRTFDFDSHLEAVHMTCSS